MARFQPDQVVDQYRITELLGVGAYAETYKATDVRTGVTVVLKMPDPALFGDPALFNRYRREAEVASRLDHPGVQRGIAWGESGTEPYLVLEYFDGESLASAARMPKREGGGEPGGRLGPPAGRGAQVPAQPRHRAPGLEAGERPRRHPRGRSRSPTSARRVSTVRVGSRGNTCRRASGHPIT